MHPFLEDRENYARYFIITVMFLFALSLTIGLVLGGGTPTDDSPPAALTPPPGDEDPTPSIDDLFGSIADLPADVTEEPFDADRVTVTSDRNTLTRVFDYKAPLPNVFEKGGEWNLVIESNPRTHYRSDSPALRGEEWSDGIIAFAPNSRLLTDITVAEDRLYALSDGTVYTAPSSDGPWTEEGDIGFGTDHVMHYDEAADEFHLYYIPAEDGGRSDRVIGHAVSPDGVSDWTVYPPAYELRDNHRVQGLDVTTVDDTYLLLVGNRPLNDHRNVTVLANDDAYAGFAPAGNVTAFSMRNEHEEVGFDHPSITYDPDEGRHVVYAQSAGRVARLYAAEVELDVQE